jgi:hypothetical protein
MTARGEAPGPQPTELFTALKVRDRSSDGRGIVLTFQALGNVGGCYVGLRSVLADGQDLAPTQAVIGRAFSPETSITVFRAADFWPPMAPISQMPSEDITVQPPRHRETTHARNNH